MIVDGMMQSLSLSELTIWHFSSSPARILFASHCSHHGHYDHLHLGLECQILLKGMHKNDRISQASTRVTEMFNSTTLVFFVRASWLTQSSHPWNHSIIVHFYQWFNGIISFYRIVSFIEHVYHIRVWMALWECINSLMYMTNLPYHNHSNQHPGTLHPSAHHNSWFCPHLTIFCFPSHHRQLVVGGKLQDHKHWFGVG